MSVTLWIHATRCFSEMDADTDTATKIEIEADVLSNILILKDLHDMSGIPEMSEAHLNVPFAVPPSIRCGASIFVLTVYLTRLAKSNPKRCFMMFDGLALSTLCDVLCIADMLHIPSIIDIIGKTIDKKVASGSVRKRKRASIHLMKLIELHHNQSR